MSKELKITVDTSYNKDMIALTTKMGTEIVSHNVVRLQEKSVREALIKLGWTPPKEEET